jgi:hypothetical protein
MLGDRARSARSGRTSSTRTPRQLAHIVYQSHDFVKQGWGLPRKINDDDNPSDAGDEHVARDGDYSAPRAARAVRRSSLAVAGNGETKEDAPDPTTTPLAAGGDLVEARFLTDVEEAPANPASCVCYWRMANPA